MAATVMSAIQSEMMKIHQHDPFFLTSDLKAKVITTTTLNNNVRMMSVTMRHEANIFLKAVSYFWVIVIIRIHLPIPKWSKMAILN